MTRMVIDRETCSRIYAILVRQANVNRDDYSFQGAFVFAHTNPFQTPSEFRFQGSLGFGGKFWVRNDGTMYVDCYPEDLNVFRQTMIDLINEALEDFRAESR